MSFEGEAVTYAGIDVGKRTLDLALLDPASGEVRHHRFRNSERGRSALLHLLSLLQPAAERSHRPAAVHPTAVHPAAARLAAVVLEASGVYHIPLLRRLLDAGLPVALANPYQVAAFRKASGVRNKTDRQDALLLARYAAVYSGQLTRYAAPPRVLAELKEVLRYREQLLTRLQQVDSRIEAARWRSGQGHGSVTLAWLEEERAQLRDLLERAEAEAQRLLQLLPEYRVLLTQKGVGYQVAAAVLAFLPQNLWGKAKQASAYAGLIPEQQHSGSSVRKSRLSRKGPALLRKKLYLAALVASRHDPEMKDFYHRLLANHKSKKQALVAVAHKILRQLMGKLKAYYREQGREVRVA